MVFQWAIIISTAMSCHYGNSSDGLFNIFYALLRDYTIEENFTFDLFYFLWPIFVGIYSRGKRGSRRARLSQTSQ